MMDRFSPTLSLIYAGVGCLILSLHLIMDIYVKNIIFFLSKREKYN